MEFFIKSYSFSAYELITLYEKYIRNYYENEETNFKMTSNDRIKFKQTKYPIFKNHHDLLFNIYKNYLIEIYLITI